jgi:hypothetical protein
MTRQRTREKRLRHAQFNITMEIYSQASSAATRDALKKLGEALLLYALVLAVFGRLIKALTCSFGAPPGTRTPNPRIKSPLLCQLS